MNWKLLWRNKDVLTPTEAASKRRVYIFAVCLVCSALFWLFTKLSQESQANIDRLVLFKNFPEGMVGVAQSDSLVSFTLESTGLRLIIEHFFPANETLLFEVGASPVVTRAGQQHHYLTKTMLVEGLERTVEGRARVIDADTDTIFVQTVPSSQKQLPVVLDAGISFERRFDQYGDVTIIPDSIWLSGPQTVLDTLEYLTTEYWETGNLKKTTQRDLRIQKPADLPSLTMEETSVSVTVPVEEFTEAYKELPIHIYCPAQFPQKDLRLFPDHVRVGYLVALRDYRAVSEQMFHVAVICPQATETSGERLPLKLEAYPSFVEILYLRPEHVEYIILE